MNLRSGTSVIRRSAVALTSALLLAAVAPQMGMAQSAGSGVTLAGSQGDTAGATLVGAHASTQLMGITLVLAPRGGSRMDRFIDGLTDPASPRFHQWLGTGGFVRRFGPSAASISAARQFLTGAGLHVETTLTPFLVRATGTTAQVVQALGTSVSDYRTAAGVTFYTNAAPVRLPLSLAGRVIGVMGLSSTVRLHPEYITTAAAAKAAAKPTPKYGGGPGGSGLTPAQIEGIYSAGTAHAQTNGRGEGTSLGLFELSGYTHADIHTYESTFFGPTENVPLVDVNVDGGPVHPVCPAGDSCGPFDSGSCQNGCDSADFSGDIEVEADIEVQIAMAPAASRVLVYNAPNDFNGDTSINELFKMANDNLADVISSSWGLCEPEDTLGSAQAEYVALAQMAAQGQSVFGASGDNGAFDCFFDPNHKGRQVDDPPSQPYMTAVGGTSMGTFDPGTDETVSYPTGFETVWNPLDACQVNDKNGCAQFGASGGGVSHFWPGPSYQHGPGVVSSFSRSGPYCSQAADGQRCREVPDVSANADEFTPYAEVCTGDRTTSGAGASTCNIFVDQTTPRGWFGIGGTSLSSPLWSAIVDLSVGLHGQRFGQANVGLYDLFRSSGAYTTYYHDITGRHQTETNNGFYPVTKNYDMATGIGTPNVSAIVMATP